MRVRVKRCEVCATDALKVLNIKKKSKKNQKIKRTSNA